LIANLLVLSDPNPGYEAERVAGVRTLRRYGIITKYPSGPLVVPSVVAAMRAAIAVPEEELEEGSGDDDEELPGRTNADTDDDELPN
jgi:hypothetical protein